MNKAIEILKEKKDDVLEILKSPELREFTIEVIEAIAVGFGKGFAQGLSEKR
jgi:hypothetical protein